jgi:hypothetical protein
VVRLSHEGCVLVPHLLPPSIGLRLVSLPSPFLLSSLPLFLLSPCLLTMRISSTRWRRWRPSTAMITSVRLKQPARALPSRSRVFSSHPVAAIVSACLSLCVRVRSDQEGGATRVQPDAVTSHGWNRKSWSDRHRSQPPADSSLFFLSSISLCPFSVVTVCQSHVVFM